MKIKEQTRKLAAGCAEVRQGDVGGLGDFRRYKLLTIKVLLA